MSQDELKAIASKLAGTPAIEVVPASNGGNSRVYMVATADKLYALKQYPSIESDPRDRLNTERMALELMHWHGIHNVPYWIAGDTPYAMMAWIDGEVINAPQEEDVAEAAVFLGTLQHISQHMHFEDMPPASEACLSGQHIVDQLEQRMEKLMPHTKENPALMQFLSKEFLPAFQKRLKAAKTAYPDFTTILPQDQMTLIAADFGFHNIMRGVDGKLYFIDFEYFGWDDPAKLMSDFLLHPATPLSNTMRLNFYNYMVGIYGEAIEQRFLAYFPLFGLRWALILLNEFIPERWEARKIARGQGDWDKVKTEQLAKARAMLAASEKFDGTSDPTRLPTI